MYHLTFGNTKFNLALLIKLEGLVEDSLSKEYLNPLNKNGFDTTGTIAFSLEYDNKKPSAKCRKSYLAKLLPEINKLGIPTLFCLDGEYFKTLTGQTKSEAKLGYVLPCKIKGFEHLKVAYGFNPAVFFYNPETRVRNQLAIKATAAHFNGTYTEIGTNVLVNTSYPTTVAQIAAELVKLEHVPIIAVDIEAFSLKHYSAGIGTISFSVDKQSAVMFTVDAVACDPYEVDIWDKTDKKYKTKIAHIKQVQNEPVRALLKTFFENYKGKLLWHNISYDATVLTYQLWMTDVLDRKGMRIGREHMLRTGECTQLMTYLATNSCAGNTLGLKHQAHEYVGNYAIEVKDIRLQTLPDLLKYNGIDTVATYFVYEKNHARMVKDEQEEFYNKIFKPALYDILEMQLTGMCLDLNRVREVQAELEVIKLEAIKTIVNTPIINLFIQDSKEQEVIYRNLGYKNKIIDINDTKFKLNLNSGKQLQQIIYSCMGLPVIDKTKSGQPSTAGKTIKKIMAHPNAKPYLECLQAFTDFSDVEKILTSFITTFLDNHWVGTDGVPRIYGSYKLGGTVSARLSASDPNIQQMPSGSRFGKLIKSCFIAPPNMVFGMSDFAGLEDVVNTLLTKDPAKELVLLDGFDGHSYRAYHFWEEKFPDIDVTSPESINSIAINHGGIRSDGKPVHFSQQYQGTWKTLVKNCGFEPSEAMMIEERYQTLYKVSFDWVKEKTKQASVDGFAVCAFGLRIRAPILDQVVLGNKKTPHEAEAEARTLGNAISGQSYCLLNGRASVEFMQRVRNSEYVDDIWLCSQIHDAIYLYWKDCFTITKWVNDNLIDCMKWQELPEIMHDKIKLSSELDIAYPSWAYPITLANNISVNEIKQTLLNEVNKRNAK